LNNEIRSIQQEPQRPAKEPSLPKVIALAGVVICYSFTQWIAGRHTLLSQLHWVSNLYPQLGFLFDQHLWEFIIGMFAILILSRGHLWSYGINSMNIRSSMKILVRFYAIAFIFIIVSFAISFFPGGKPPLYFKTLNLANFVGWMVFEWLATAVADEIFFHGLFQTVLLKYWKDEFVLWKLKIPVAVLFSTIIFASGRTNVPLFGGSDLEYILALLIGLYTGLVYYKTRSLLTPMLSQAFFYGMPFAVRYAYFHIWR
jgi:membrane protease YdiL (CAAX protease family)